MKYQIEVKLEDGVLKFNKQFRIKDGVQTPKFSRALIEYIGILEDGEYEITLQPLEMAKTYDQIKYIHKLCSIYADEVGSTQIGAKIACKELCGFYSVHINALTKEPVKQLRSFADASITEMSALIDKWYNFLTVEAGLQVPTAEEYKGEIK